MDEDPLNGITLQRARLRAIRWGEIVGLFRRKL